MLGGVDALLHFAAIWVGTPWDKSEQAEWDRVVAVNIKGTFFLTQAVARHMVERGRGAIVLTTSDSVNVDGVAGGPAYVASKGSVVGLTHSFAKALGPKGVRVNAVSPGGIDTPMTTTEPRARQPLLVHAGCTRGLSRYDTRDGLAVPHFSGGERTHHAHPEQPRQALCRFVFDDTRRSGTCR